MSFYVSRWPDQCDPRDGGMGFEKLNGIQLPPARIFFEDRGPGTPVSNWTYDGVLGSFEPLPEMFLPFITEPCTPRFVVWEIKTNVMLGPDPHPFEVRIEKRQRSLATVNDWDSYWIQLKIDNVASDQFVEYLQLSSTDYSRYQAQTPGQPWTWTPGAVQIHEVSWTEAWPTAWDRTSPGPPYVPGL